MAEAVEDIPRLSGHSNSLTARGTSSGVGLPQPAHFHRFPDLPAELRHKIFQACLPRRLFRFSYEQLCSPFKGLSEESEKPSALPWIAFVCKEAYEVSKLFVREYRMEFIIETSVEDVRVTYETTRIRFDPHLDTLLLSVCPITEAEEPYAPVNTLDHVSYLQNLRNGPYALSMMPKINITLDMGVLVGPRRPGNLWGKWLTARPYWECLAQHGHFTVRLASTVISTTSMEIRSSGLFGMFGEERNVLIDITDTAKINQYEGYIDQLELAGRGHSDGENYLSEKPGGRLAEIGAGRYGTEDGAPAESDGVSIENGDDASALSTVSSSIAEEDGAMALYLIKQAWLEANHCFEPAEEPLLPWTGDEMFRQWNDEHHVAKHWLSKLPTFSFVVMYTVTERKDIVCTD